MSRFPRIHRSRRGWRTTWFRFLGSDRMIESRTLIGLLRQLWRTAYSPRAIRRRLAIQRFYRSKLPRDVYEILHGEVPR